MRSVASIGVLLMLCNASCAHPQSAAATEPPDTVVLPASVPGGASFCIEELYLSWPTDDVFIRRSSGLVCKWTVADVRNWAARQKAADE